MKVTKIALLALATVGLAPFLTGCASVMCGSQQDISVDSRPRGADVLVYDSNCEVIYKSTTPCVTTLKRKNGDSKKGTYVVVVNKEGYDSVQVPLIAHVNSAYYLNVITMIGFLVDPITGAMWGLQAERPDGYAVKDNASFFDSTGLFVALEERPEAAFIGPKKPVTAPPVEIKKTDKKSGVVSHTIQASTR
jgi:hypothetical protein